MRAAAATAWSTGNEEFSFDAHGSIVPQDCSLLVHNVTVLEEPRARDGIQSTVPPHRGRQGSHPRQAIALEDLLG